MPNPIVATNLQWPERIADFAAALEAKCGDIVWLDSAAPAWSTDARPVSIIGFAPAAVIEQFAGQPARLSADGRVIAESASIWDLWRQTTHRLETWHRAAHHPSGAGPGWIGYIAFEAARLLERLPQRRRDGALGLPIARLALYDRVACRDHTTGRAWRLDAPGTRERLGIDAFNAARWDTTWGSACAASPAQPAGAASQLCFEQTRTQFQAAVARVQSYIVAGDVYQVNLAHRARLRLAASPARTYARVRLANPAAYGAVLSWQGAERCGVLSVSPERMLEVRGRQAISSPIKGTRPRVGNRERDAAARAELLASAKDAAELAMIVDLHRNDLGRVCVPGSIRVESARRLEEHPRVFHTVADVAGCLRDGCNAIDALAASFPAGSVTGVPKIRALQLIDELEPVERGAYCGAIGWLGLDGDATWNVAIRTLQVAGACATLHVGGGIVAESTPPDEFDETLAKARGLLDGLGLTGGAARLEGAQCANG